MSVILGESLSWWWWWQARPADPQTSSSCCLCSGKWRYAQAGAQQNPLDLELLSPGSGVSQTGALSCAHLNRSWWVGSGEPSKVKPQLRSFSPCASVFHRLRKQAEGLFSFHSCDRNWFLYPSRCQSASVCFTHADECTRFCTHPRCPAPHSL